MADTIKTTLIGIFFLLLFTGSGSADTQKNHSDMHGHDMADHNMAGEDRIGALVHESVVDGYMLAYHLMDLRDHNKEDKAAMKASHGMTGNEMDKPHHLMLYIMDKNHRPVTEGKVGFLIKRADGNVQKIMGMAMSKGFGITADMKEKGTYQITAKAVMGETQIMDRFDHEIK